MVERRPGIADSGQYLPPPEVSGAFPGSEPGSVGAMCLSPVFMPTDDGI